MSDCFWYALAGVGVFYLVVSLAAAVTVYWVAWKKGGERDVGGV